MSGGYELFTATDAAELWARIDADAQRFFELVRSVPPDLPLKGSTWTTREVVGHLLTVIRRYTRGPTLGETPRDVDRINDEELAALGAAPCTELLDQLERELKLARELYAPEALDLHMKVSFHGGVRIDFAAALGNVIGELLIHGLDLAAAAGRPWSLDDRDAVLILNGVLQILPAYAVRDTHRSLRVRLSVPGARPWLLDFHRGELTSAPAETGVASDVVVRAPASTLALTLYSRLSTTRAVRGGMRVVGGRRPWRLARLPALVERP